MFRPLLMSILMALLVTTTAMAYPKAGDQPERWQLTFDAGDLRFFRDHRSGDGYWVLVYEIMNEDGEDHIWAPSLDLVTDRGEVIADVEDVPRRVYLTILDWGSHRTLPKKSSRSSNMGARGISSAPPK